MSYFQVTSSTIQIQMQVFDLPKLCKLIMDVFLCGFLLHAGDKEDPALHS